MDLFGQENKIKKVKKESIYSRPEQKAIVRQEFRNKHCAETVIDFPKDGEVAMYISHGMSDAASFLYAFYKKYGIIEEAYIATWTISKKNVLNLIDYLDQGKIKKLTFLLNDGMLKTGSTKPIYGLMRMEFDNRKVNYAVANSHAKVQSYKNNKASCTISGSGNWSENPRIEDYVLVGGEKTFNFTKNWIDEIIKQ